MVPRVLHSGWIGPSPMPEREKKWCDQMRAMNPMWTYKLFGNEILPRFERDPYIRTMIDRGMPWAFITDRIRILLLMEEGGVWLDPDCQPIRPLDTLSKLWDSPEVEFVMSCRNPYRHMVALSRGINFFDNTFLGASPKSRIVKRIAALWRPETMQGTGVIDGGMCGREAAAHLDGVADRLLGYREFYDLEVGPNTIVLHDSHNRGSWVQELKQLRTANA